MADAVGQADLRAENVSRIVTGFALQEFKLLQICSIEASNSWTEKYQQETSADLTGGLGSNVRGVPRLAAFPYGEVTWTEQTDRLEKYGMDGIISWEDGMTNEIDVIARTLLRVARAVAKAVDDRIYAVITANTANDNASLAAWNATVIADRNPIQDILDSKTLIAEDEYDPDRNGFLLLNPKDYGNLLGNANIRNAGQFYTDEVTRNGNVGKLLGLKVIRSTSITADEACVIIGKEAITWKQAHPLTVHTIEDPGVKWTIRAWTVGVAQLNNPNAKSVITNTAL